MPTYEYYCPSCGARTSEVRTVAARNDHPLCDCGGDMSRGYFTAPEVRTPKTSRTFLDGMRSSERGFTDLQRAAELREQRLKARPDSEKYRELTREINQREGREVIGDGKKFTIGKGNSISGGSSTAGGSSGGGESAAPQKSGGGD